MIETTTPRIIQILHISLPDILKGSLHLPARRSEFGELTGIFSSTVSARMPRFIILPGIIITRTSDPTRTSPIHQTAFSSSTLSSPTQFTQLVHICRLVIPFLDVLLEVRAEAQKKPGRELGNGLALRR
jgi:hypothetical protein